MCIRDRLINDTIDKADLDRFNQLVTEFMQEGDYAPETIAAALAHIAQSNKPLFETETEFKPAQREFDRDDRSSRNERSRGKPNARDSRDGSTSDSRERRKLSLTHT